ncbi:MULTISPECIES: helix-turn-helix domain-containing protein [Paenibacillus]|uniref:helix-turn-helix domain-containing protein n=1 Tax=Paenibacillus TaxID=44249 RepID=UPI0022B8C140|nr:helix-turn-helix transcriptional regulator [Paenibacillus caseinilyticus]MCZ8522465.1 helix-turn-helix transcriptional regulator [Paenibacillus caseinilyticus]
MSTWYGQQLRELRELKGMEVTEFAKELGVAPGYLRNLETGRTQTIQLEILSRLEKELYWSPEEELSPVPGGAADTGMTQRLEQAMLGLQELAAIDPEACGYLLGMVEQGLRLVRDRPAARPSSSMPQ